MAFLTRVKWGLLETVSRNQVNSPCLQECYTGLIFEFSRLTEWHCRQLEELLVLGRINKGQRFCPCRVCSVFAETEGINARFPQSPVNVCAFPHRLDDALKLTVCSS